MIRRISLAAAAGLALGLAAPAARAASTLVVCTEASPAVLNPQLSTANTVFDVGAQIYDELVETERGGSVIQPALAESWSTAPDGLSVTFHLRRGVKFHANKSFTPTRDLTATDVVFSFNRMLDPNHPFHRIGGLSYDEWDSLLRDRVNAVVAVDDHTVRFDLKEPVASLLGILSMQSFAIFSAEYAEKLLAAGTPERLDSEPIGTGAFSFVRYQRDTDLRFRAFPQHWAKQARLPDRVAQVESLVFTIVPDPAVRLAKLRAGECHIARYPNPADFDAIRANPQLRLASGKMASIGYIAFRSDRPPFDKREVREALAMAIDLKSLVASVFQGVGEPTGALIPPVLWGHNPGVRPRPYDPAAAKAKLVQAGYPEGFRTQIWAIPVARAYMPNGRRAAEMIQADWAKIGVQAEIVTYEWGEYLRRVRSSEAPVGMLGGSWDYPDPSQLVYGYWACPGGKPRPGNWSRWCNAAFSDLVSRANVVSDPVERTKLYQQAQEVFAEDVPAVLFADTPAFSAVRSNVVGYKVHVLGGTPFTGITLRP
ncbi:Dipeptide-binding protein [Rhodovastum atsumiense]|uniref:ABC transporter substrate-binding protein n=1 Tax=Rhodovastum atsumiense TaxID=504468 RepID=A0A5M6IPZ0_9PROT|nr:ABC transporter substrate-binding protein [Rhodovastum atsumiense]KAA5609969.1 ABC transporter substrate-binding protein [Rhodovastum atsumiense]CAH2598608.1 Dipeptide-binding protein [Rhodovastum atsumiense]